MPQVLPLPRRVHTEGKVALGVALGWGPAKGREGRIPIHPPCTPKEPRVGGIQALGWFWWRSSWGGWGRGPSHPGACVPPVGQPPSLPAPQGICHTSRQTSGLWLSLGRRARPSVSCGQASMAQPSPASRVRSESGQRAAWCPPIHSAALCTRPPRPGHGHGACGCRRVFGTCQQSPFNAPRLRHHSRVLTSLSDLGGSCSVSGPTRKGDTMSVSKSLCAFRGQTTLHC